MLACGPGAVLSHRSAAAAWALAEADPDVIDITLNGRRCRPKLGVRIRSVAHLHRLDISFLDGLELTAPARTLLDFAAGASTSELERAVTEARRRKIVTWRALDGAIDRAPTRRGARALRTLLRSQADPAFTRSTAERRLLALIRNAELPEPQVNARVHGFEVDFYWPAAGLVLEVDGHAFHGDRPAFERDRLRDQALVAAGLRVVRVTWRQIVEEPFALVVRIAQAIRPSSAGTLRAPST